MNPLMHIFRERELEFMLGHSEASVAIIPSTFRDHDYRAMYDGLRDRAAAPAARHRRRRRRPERLQRPCSRRPTVEPDPDVDEILTVSRPGPDDITQLIFTSGTTGEPKGVMHSSNTLYSNIVPYAERLHLDSDDVVLMASPMAHQTGFMYGLMMPVILGCPAVLLDVWNPDRAIEIINEHAVTFTMASTPFLTDLADRAEATVAVPSLRTFLCAGAPIPGPLVERAQRTLASEHRVGMGYERERCRHHNTSR